MKYFSLLLFSLLFLFNCQNKKKETNLTFINQDIHNFWEAFDKIQGTTDTLEQQKYLQDIFLTPASEGQKAMITARRYTPQQYLEAIHKYPKFWASIRDNTLKTKGFSNQINDGVEKLQRLYPALRSSTIYFTMGVFRSPGTTTDSMVLIGCEFALGDENVVTDEFPENMDYVKAYHKMNPINDIVFLNVHEYVHTQQKEMVYNILSLTLYEGVAEFVAEKVVSPSISPALAFGKKHEEAVRKKFEKDIFINRKRSDWLWNDKNNEFETRDMSYYVGYTICEKYYNAAADKTQAIQDLINLDFNNEDEIEKFVDGTGYLSVSLAELYDAFQEKRATVNNIQPFKNETQNVSPKTTKIIAEFSKKMLPPFNSIGLGELGKEHFPKIISREFSADSLSFIYEVELEANKRYQMLLENGFRDLEGIPLQPYLIDFKTGK